MKFRSDDTFDHQAMWEYQIGDYMARLDAEMPMELETVPGEAELSFLSEEKREAQVLILVMFYLYILVLSLEYNLV